MGKRIFLFLVTNLAIVLTLSIVLGVGPAGLDIGALATLKIHGTRGWMVFFSTHPSLEARIAALSTGR